MKARLIMSEARHLIAAKTFALLGMGGVILNSIVPTTSSASTVAYYRFEGSTSGGTSAPWLADSSGNGYNLVSTTGTPTQISSVLNPVPGNNLTNISAASLNANRFYTNPITSGPITSMSSITLEAFIRWNESYIVGADAEPGTIVSQWDSTGNLCSYMLAINSSGHPILTLNPGGTNPTGTTFIASAITLSRGSNYYIAVTFDLADTAQGVKFYQLDLTSTQSPLRFQQMGQSMGSIRPATARLVIGDSAYSGTSNFFLGNIDEVRVSNKALDRGELLIAGPSFRDLSGVNQTGTTNTLFSQAISYQRTDVSWASLEPSQGNWQQSVLNGVGTNVLAFHAQQVGFLPILDYTVPWAADTSARIWYNFDASVKYTTTPNSDGSITLSTYTKQTDGTYTLTSTANVTDFSRFPPASSSTWINYVSKVTTFLAAPPYNVRYFQIWNEAWYTSGFWKGSFTDYFQKVHIPAAAIIHAAGGKVVYGGWPDDAPLTDLISLLDTNNAWGSIDVIDFHYLNPATYATLRSAADSRGYTNLQIWQTECGFTSYVQFPLDQYTRILYWALGNNWDSTDKYKAMYYANNSPNDPAAYGYGKTYYSGTSLAPQGVVLQTLASLLMGPGLRQFAGVTSLPALTASPSPSTSALQAFKIGAKKIAITMELNTATYSGNTNIVLTMPLAKAAISAAKRVDLTGTVLDLTSQLTASGSSTTLSVPVMDAAGSTSRTWNDATTGNRGVLVEIDLH